ncbi:uncharacterized protein LY79DRAFT_389190 [Colletotrichum navitas]|uniref:Uncharacterized protein n=1 Tax=Colletotrichum navitas TaxID=681940 RepID=A0AAD8PQX3_9PEZI|nr:uncharacterized protein LY79DRAFT_389190 [Colletotrichum navitas]KAK1574100.1 hypothetical protein LY79DRAFT_389190 [Colletotrichum navitas]
MTVIGPDWTGTGPLLDWSAVVVVWVFQRSNKGVIKGASQHQHTPTGYARNGREHREIAPSSTVPLPQSLPPSLRSSSSLSALSLSLSLHLSIYLSYLSCVVRISPKHSFLFLYLSLSLSLPLSLSAWSRRNMGKLVMSIVLFAASSSQPTHSRAKRSFGNVPENLQLRIRKERKQSNTLGCKAFRCI